MKRILVVFGTRPEAIKMAPVVRALKEQATKFQCLVCVTAQHREMLDQVLDIFGIVPDFDLDIMKRGQDLYDVTSRVLLGMREVLTKCSPDLVLVHGDTTTTLATTLAAFYRQIPVGHVEAGLRTHNLYSPWPEEANRVLTGRLATYHFAPTILSSANLAAEGVNPSNICVTGNTVIDALYYVLNRIKASNILEEAVIAKILISGYKLSSRPLVLITGHRRENFGQGLINICKAIKKLGRAFQNIDFVYPVHLNPNVQEPVRTLLDRLNNVFLIDPLEYEPFVYLMNRAYFIITDSGGIQEEAPSLGKPVLVMRERTERPEAVEAGTVKLVGTNTKSIVDAARTLIEQDDIYLGMSRAHNPYGDGAAAEKILEYLTKPLISKN